MASIQFRGLSQTMTAFENRGVDAWSLWDGKAFMFKGIGSNDLTTILESLNNSGTTAIYTLKVYEDVTDVKKIKASTDCDGSFNFRLYEREDEVNNYRPGQSYEHVRQLTERVNTLEERILAALETKQEEETEEPETNFIGTITGLLQDPDKLEKLITLGRSLLGQPVQPAYVGNVNKLAGPGNGSNPSLSPSSQQPAAVAPMESQYTPEDQQERVERLAVAVDTLEKADPAILEHLEKLASMAANKPDQFKMLVSMIDIY